MTCVFIYVLVIIEINIRHTRPYEFKKVSFWTPHINVGSADVSTISLQFQIRSVISPCATRVRKVSERFMSIQTHIITVFASLEAPGGTQPRAYAKPTESIASRTWRGVRARACTRKPHTDVRASSEILRCSRYRDSLQKWTMNSRNTPEDMRLTLSARARDMYTRYVMRMISVWLCVRTRPHVLHVC